MQLLRRVGDVLPTGHRSLASDLDRQIRNPADGKDYIISYNDCCGKQAAPSAPAPVTSEEPAYRPFNNNDVNWCLAAKSHIYHCRFVIRGVAA